MNAREFRGARAPWFDPAKLDRVSQRVADRAAEAMARKGVDAKDIAFVTTNGNDIPCSDYLRFESFIAMGELPYQRLPASRATARRIDAVSDALIPPYRTGGLEAVRELILDQPAILDPITIPTLERHSYLSIGTLIERLRESQSDRDIKMIIDRLSLSALCAAYACLDAETMRHWHEIEPRSLFTLMLPDEDDERVQHPVRRLIDFMACCAFGGRDEVARGHVPTTAEIKEPIFRKLGGNEDRLNGWRNGRVFLSLEQAVKIWEALHEHENRTPPPVPPIAMIIAATVFQGCLVSYSKGRKRVNAIISIEPIYEPWWAHHSALLEWPEEPASRMAWPVCFDNI